MQLGSLLGSILVRLLAYYAMLAGASALVWSLASPGVRRRLSDLWMPGAPAVLADPLGAVGPVVVAPLQTLFASLAACALALPVAWVYMRTRRAQGFSQSVAHALVLLPTVVAAITVLVKESLPLAFSLAGIVAAVRFRNTLEDSKDAVFILLGTAIGLASGVSPAVGAVLSVVFVSVVLVLWAADFAREPAPLEGERARQKLGRAMAIANRTSQFVARVDREVLESLAPAQLDALAERVRRRRKRTDADAGAEDGSAGAAARYDRRIVVSVSDPAAVRQPIEQALEAYTKRWRFEGARPTGGDDGSVVYAVRLRRGISEELMTTAIR
ncbi:MAG: DUF4956 domain-containing protein, partial [Gemmatimonadaceae bacterium]